MNTQIVTLQIKKIIDVEVVKDTQFVLDFSNIISTQKLHPKAPFDVGVNLHFVKQGVTAELIGLYRLFQNQSVNFVTAAIHKVPNTSSNILIKGVLDDKSMSSYLGKIIIQKRAQQTSSFLKDDVLVVGDSTKNRSDPILEIEADDVQASHGSTTGRLNKDQLYYLQSRGLPKKMAAQTIIDAYFESVLNTIVDVKAKECVYNNLIKK